MKEHHSKIDFELEVLSPVHVGLGSKYSKLDFIYDPKRRQAGLLHEESWLQWLRRKGLVEQYMQAVQQMGIRMDNNEWLIRQRISDPLQQCKDLFTVILATDQDVNTLNEISRQIKNVFLQPYIPGSSIKGVFRTAVMTHLLCQARENGDARANQAQQIWDFLRQSIMKLDDSNRFRRELDKISRDAVNKIEELFFKPLSDQTGEALDRTLPDPFRGLLVSDSAPFDRQSTILAKKHDLVVPPGKNIVSEISLWRECIRPGSKTTFSVTLNQAILREAGLDFLHDADSLLNCISSYRKVVLDRHEKRLSEEINNSPNKNIYKLQTIKSVPGTASLTIGGGTGFQTKSLIYALAPDAKLANELVEILLEKQFNRKRKGKDRIASPRTLKTTWLGGGLNGDQTGGRYKMGICAIKEIRHADSSGNSSHLPT